VAVLFVISGGLRQFAGSRSDIRVDAAAGPLSVALARLWSECPAVRDRVLTERGDVRTHINIFVDGEDIRYTGGLDTEVRDGAEVFIVPAVSGGCRGNWGAGVEDGFSGFFGFFGFCGFCGFCGFWVLGSGFSGF